MKSFLFLLLLLPIFVLSQEEPKEDPDSVVNFTNLDREAEFSGGIEAMKKYLGNNVVYPDIAMEMGDFGKVFLEFVVNKDGSLEQVKILQGVSAEIDKEAIRVVENMPNWIPAIYKGELVRVRCRIPINFILLDDTENHIYDYPQITAQFPRGNRAMAKFINKNLKYPETAIKNGDEGEVIVEFVVNKNGSIEQIKVVQSISKELDAEAVRLVQEMPRWKPGVHQRKRVRTRYKLPLNFKL